MCLLLVWLFTPLLLHVHLPVSAGPSQLAVNAQDGALAHPTPYLGSRPIWCRGSLGETLLFQDTDNTHPGPHLPPGPHAGSFTVLTLAFCLPIPKNAFEMTQRSSPARHPRASGFTSL